MINKNILISGAGVSGLALAYWLKRFGFNPTVVEKHSAVRTGGYKIDCRGVALDIVKRMGIYDAIVVNQTAISRAICVDNAGNQIAEMTADLCGIRQEGVDLEIMRGNLCLIMKEAAHGIEYIFDDSITQISQDQQSVHVQFEKSQPRTFDLVIGADGLHSVVRKLVFGEETQFAQELGISIAVFSIPNILDVNDCEIEYFLPRKFVNVYKDHKESNARVAIAFTSKPCRSRDAKEQKKLIEEVFVDAGWKVPQILSAMQESTDFFFDSMAQIHMPHWSKGRVALIGDAAYSPTPMSGQGTSIALVGAYVLAGELAEAKGDYTTAFSKYDTLIRPFITQNQALADMSIRIMTGNIFMKWLQQLMNLLPAKVILYFKNQSLKNTTKAANAITLKDYSQLVL